MFDNIYSGKTVLVTGHTGFKGSWLCSWLDLLGARVVGVSLPPTTSPSLFQDLQLGDSLTNYFLDITKSDSLTDVLHNEKPSFVFHLAAQAIVSTSYKNPLQTFETNLLGTINLLEALKDVEVSTSAVFITSDKCYRNNEWIWGYRENDHLGGNDPYSASKACAEIAIHSYFKSFFYSHKHVRLATARAGNVIGGGDWSPNRIIPDCFRAWIAGLPLELRNPDATRPWQHVLEPLSGYLSLANQLSSASSHHINGQSFNFGPRNEDVVPVKTLVDLMATNCSFNHGYHVTTPNSLGYESGLLQLNCDKAYTLLHWKPVLSVQATSLLTSQWYSSYHHQTHKPTDLVSDQIFHYTKLASQAGLNWAL